MKKSFLLFILFGLFSVVANAQQNKIPEDFRKFINETEFITTISTHCNIALDFYGKKGIDEEDCVLFEKKVLPWINKSERILKKYSKTNNKFDVRAISRDFTRNFNTIMKTLEHIHFFGTSSGLPNKKKETYTEEERKLLQLFRKKNQSD